MCPYEVDIYRIYLAKGDTLLLSSSDSSGMGDYSLSISSPDGLILDSQYGSANDKSVIAEVTSTDYYYITLKNRSSEKIVYSLTPEVDGSGGKIGEEVITIYPFEKISSSDTGLYEIRFQRTPQNAVVETLYLSIIVEHNSPQDLIISAQYADAPEQILWNGYGGSTDGGKDDDVEDDADIEIYNREIISAKGKGANDSLLIMIEDYSSLSGTIFAIEARLFWKKK